MYLIGGGGYLGSILLHELIKRNIFVHVFDYCLYGLDAFTGINEGKQFSFYRNDFCAVNREYKIDTGNVPSVIVNLIDYPVELSIKQYEYMIERETSAFGRIIDCFPNVRIIQCGTWKRYLSNEYAKIMALRDTKLDSLFNSRGIQYEFIIIPELVGPAPRVRFDTLLNDKLIHAYVSGNIITSTNRFKIPCASVFDIAKYILDSINSVYDDKNKYRILFDELMTQADIAVLIKRIAFQEFGLDWPIIISSEPNVKVTMPSEALNKIINVYGVDGGVSQILQGLSNEEVGNPTDIHYYNDLFYKLKLEMETLPLVGV